MVRVLDLADAELSSTTPPVRFPDVGPGELGEALTALTALRVVTGYPDGTFRPTRTLERAQLASLLARTAEALGLDLPATPAGFADVGTSVHAGAIDAMTTLGVLQGRTAIAFAPAATATRAQAASVLVRLLGALVLDGQLPLPSDPDPDPDPCAVDEPPAEIRSVFDADRMVQPDDVRGGHDTLEEAVLAGAWPTLAACAARSCS